MQTPPNIFRLLRQSEGLLRRMKNVPKYHRTYLSQAYACEEQWNKRLDSPLLKQVNIFEMFFDIERKFQRSNRLSAVDVDIFTNVVQNTSSIEEVVTLLQKLRQTTEATNILPSTHHAVVRYFLKCNKIKELFTILNDRLTYGIIPDSLCYNLMMNTFIEKQDFALAARIATLLMLQEEVENPISNAFALYSCHRYLEKPDEWKAPVIIKDEPKEEVKVRVKYIREPYFDDHFDLTEPSDLVGKTLAYYGKHAGNVEGRSCQLRGLILFKKYEQANKLIDQWIKDKINSVIFNETITLIQKDKEKLLKEESNDNFKAVKSLIDKLSVLETIDGNLTNALEKNVKTATEKQEKADIDQMSKNYVFWEENRMKILQNHLAELNKQDKKEEFAQIKKDLEDKERILTFFDKEEEIELEIERKLSEEQTKWGHIKIKKETEEDTYIPPEVRKRTEVRESDV